MTHNMKLVDFAFKAMKNKEKDIELRLNDEKKYGGLAIEIKLI